MASRVRDFKYEIQFTWKNQQEAWLKKFKIKKIIADKDNNTKMSNNMARKIKRIQDGLS